MKRIGWENGTLVSKGKVNIGGNIYEVEPEQYEGSTPISAENLKKMEDNTEEAIDELQRHMITAKGNGASIIAMSNGSKVELAEAITVGTKTTLSNGGIKIGAGAKKISIEATTVFVDGSTGQHGLYIYKNTKTEVNLLARTMLNTINGTDVQSSLNITKRIVDNISEGDIIYVYVSSNINASISAPLTMLTVEVVET